MVASNSGRWGSAKASGADALVSIQPVPGCGSSFNNAQGVSAAVQVSVWGGRYRKNVQGVIIRIGAIKGSLSREDAVC